MKKNKEKKKPHGRKLNYNILFDPLCAGTHVFLSNRKEKFQNEICKLK